MANLSLILPVLEHCRSIQKTLLEATGRVCEYEFEYRVTDVTIGVKHVARPENAIASLAQKNILLDLDFSNAGYNIKRLIFTIMTVISWA